MEIGRCFVNCRSGGTPVSRDSSNFEMSRYASNDMLVDMLEVRIQCRLRNCTRYLMNFRGNRLAVASDRVLVD